MCFKHKHKTGGWEFAPFHLNSMTPNHKQTEHELIKRIFDQKDDCWLKLKNLASIQNELKTSQGTDERKNNKKFEELKLTLRLNRLIAQSLKDMTV